MKKFIFGLVFCTLISAVAFYSPSFAMEDEIGSSELFQTALKTCPRLVEELAEPLSQWKKIHDRASAAGFEKFDELLLNNDFDKVLVIMALLKEAEDFTKIAAPRVNELVDLFAKLQEKFPGLAADPDRMFKLLSIDVSFSAIKTTFREFLMTNAKEIKSAGLK